MSVKLYPVCVKIAQFLQENGMRLAVAESCTAGALASQLVAVPGASTWFDCGIVAYSNTAKQTLLDVPVDAIAQHGAVSAQVAQHMADGIAHKQNCDLSLSTTGIAGPGGGSVEKPVGTVYLAVSGTYFDDPAHFHPDPCLLYLRGGRKYVQEQAIFCALNWLCDILCIV